jgi:hypothetical protein
MIFGHCLRFLTAEGGLPEKQARALLGKWRRDQGDGAVIDACSTAQRLGVSDPVAWIEGRWRGLKVVKPIDGGPL